MPELDSPGFADREEVRRVEIDEAHLLEVKRDFPCVSIDLCLQLLYLFEFHSAAEPENLDPSIHRRLYLQDHQRISLAQRATEVPRANY